MKIKFLIIFIVIIVFVFLIFKYEKQTTIDEYLSTKTENFEVMYESIYNHFKADSKVIFTHMMSAEHHDLIDIYKKMNNTLNMQEQDLLRKKLYQEFKHEYKNFKQLKLKQLHFHLPNNKSFLRMHAPSKYSDDLTNVRKTVAYVNKNKIPIDGFENGRIYSGFRFVYPIKDKDNVYLGSLEVAFDVSAFTSKFMENYKVLCNFHIDKNIIDKITWDEFKQKYYVKSPFNGFYLEKRTLNEVKKYNKTFDIDKKKMKSKSAKAIGIQNVKSKKSVSVFDKTVDGVITFIPITNPVTEEVNAFFTIRSDSEYIKNKTLNFYFVFMLVVFFTIIVLLLIYKILTTKDNLNELLKEIVKKKTKKLKKFNKNLERTVKERTNELKLSKYRMKDYINLVDKNIITSSTDLKGNITKVSQAFCDISGYGKEELIGKPHNIVRHPDTPKKVFEELWDNCKNDKVFKGEFMNLRKDGGFYWISISIYPVYNEDNEKIGYTSIGQDISNKKLIEEISITDGLTGIYNRRHFDKQFPKIINSAKRNNELVCFLIMDIDHFKQYNDTYGHQMGDDVLIKVASSIKDSLNRVDDTCYRLGGEEFGVIFKSKSQQDAFWFSNNIRENIEKLKIKHKQSSADDYITVSMGLICKYANDIDNVDIIYKEADDLLYDAKNSGKNKISAVIES